MTMQWIKMRVALWDCPQCVRLASALQADRARIVGALFRTWCLADQYSVDGRLAGYDGDALDASVGIAGWSTAMERVGWLVIGADAVTIPRFLEHNGQSAKRRAEDAARKKRVRKKSASDADTRRTHCGPEKRKRRAREEKSKNGDESSRDDHLDLVSKKEELRSLCTRKFCGVFPSSCRQDPADREFLLKVGALLLAGSIPEEWVDSALEAIRHHKKPIGNRIGYFTIVLKDEAASHRFNLLAALAKVKVPADLVTPRSGDEGGEQCNS